jgi:TonB family protein
MSGRRYVTLAYALVLAAHSHVTLAQSAAAAAPSNSGAPPADSIVTARLAWGSDPAKRCPDLRNAAPDGGAVAVVLFRVGPTGVPSRASVGESSGSQGFDSAAVSCVLKLRFQSATRFGDGVAVESWQQLALKSAAAASAPAPQTARCDPAGAGQGSAAARNSVVVADASESTEGRRAQPGPETARAGVCVCVDESGKITQTPVLTSSSGSTGFDKAALELSAAAHYRPAISASGQPAPGCFRFKVGLEVK